jgi:predicted DNA-binding transcriptional regulator AlpA
LITTTEEAFIAETQRRNADMADDLLTQKQVAQRWALSERTLERWRTIGEGPVYVKLGSAVRYRLTDIEAFEQAGTQKQPKNGKDLLAKVSCTRRPC